jgi:phosphoribosylglycinamide formyltransferase-1
MKTEIIVMLSGKGTTLEAILNRCKNIKVVGVISSNPNVRGVQLAQSVGIPVSIADSSQYIPESLAVANELHYRIIKIVEKNPNVRYIVLAGFMKIIPKWIIQYMNNDYGIDIINIHPSLLPNYKGLNTHQRVLEAGDKKHGMTIHYVNEEVDGGDIIFQKEYGVMRPCDVDDLEQRVKFLEQKYYPIILDILPSQKGHKMWNITDKDLDDLVKATGRTELDKFKDNLIACGLGHLLDGVAPPSDAQKTIE